VQIVNPDLKIRRTLNALKDQWVRIYERHFQAQGSRGVRDSRRA
jgi:hypothetical protein